VRLDRGLVAAAATVFVATVACLSVPGTPADFANWDPECRLVVGDELTRDRPWNGSIETFAVFDRTLDWREVRSLSRGAVSAASLSPAYVAGPFEPLDSIRGEPLLDEAAQKTFHDRLVSSGRTSVFVRFATSDEGQSGPARIAGCSKSPFAQNFSVGQQSRALTFRLRTRTTAPGGYYPQTETPPILLKGRATSVAATYDGQNVRLFTDGRYQARLNLMIRGRPFPFLADSGLPASAAVVGMMMGLVWVGLVRGPSAGFRQVTAGAMGGLVGGMVLVAAGGVSTFPEFAPWVPVVSAWGGAVAGGSVITRGEE